MNEKNDQNPDEPVTNSNSQVGNTPVLANLIYATPTGGTLPPAHPLDEEIVQEAPMGQTIIYNQDSVGETFTPGSLIDPLLDSMATMLSPEEAERYRARWNEIQGRFVDEPRSAVQKADALVCEVNEKITQQFAIEYSALEEQWKQGKDVSTEDLRKTLQHYRAFFNRLLIQIPS